MTRPLTGRGVLLWVTGFFAFIIAVNVSFIIFSVRTFRGEDEQKPYLQGVEYNRTLARRAEQRKLDWHATIVADRIAAAGVRIRVALRRADGSPQTGLSLRGELRHPMDENRDRPMRLKEVGIGQYQVDLPDVAAGSWDVVVLSSPGEPPFETSRRLWLR